MKSNLLTLFFLVFICCACQKPVKSIDKAWRGQSIDFSQLREVTNTYYMYDSAGLKVGSMIFGFSFEDGFLIARDTSQFDDGSVYETAEFTFDTTDFRMNKVSTDMRTPRAILDIDLRRELDRLIGTYTISRDTSSTTFEIDSAYQFTNFRGEVYMMAHALSIKPQDTITLQSLVPTSMSISQGLLVYSGIETIETLNGIEQCDAFWLRADGKMPDNKLWVTQRSPRAIAKFYIPGAKLSIVLVKQKAK